MGHIGQMNHMGHQKIILKKNSVLNGFISDTRQLHCDRARHLTRMTHLTFMTSRTDLTW